MTYFVTGATGFIGRFLVQALLQRGKGTIYVLVRPKSVGKLDDLGTFWGKESARRVVPIKGDLGQPKLGVSKADLTRLKGKVKQTWGDLTDDDVDVAEGEYDELVGRIKTRTGETQEAIERRLDMD